MPYSIMLDAGHGGCRLRKKEPEQYTVEREFLSKLTMEELLVRIIESHLKEEGSDSYDESESI
ncbi:MAG: hypothetical protein ACI4F1_01195 [Bariatricus sp.]